ncbi:MAG: AAA family ATPase [Cetobacterium sp.]|uniref:AAA family ATPase n=1 Tax=Cetobacterium sp. TaxID=2071632 RepID=UPI003F404FC3
MIFESITLENFRPYYGNVKIEFCNGEKNITLIKAENGSGKTTLLESMRWGLYGGDLKLTSGDKKIGAQSFINKKYLDENPGKELSAKVIINLLGKDLSGEGQEKKYEIRREVFFKNDIHLRTELFLKIDNILHKTDESNLKDIIQKILPEEIDFFIDGERLDVIAPEIIKGRSAKKNESTKKIQESIFRVLGIKSLENAVKDTRAVAEELKVNYLQNSGISQDVLNLQNEEDKIKADLEKDDKVLVELEKEHILVLEEIDELEEELTKIPQKINEKANLESILKEKNFEIKKLEQRYKSVNENYKSFLSVKAVEKISDKIVSNAFKIINAKRRVGEIPTKYEQEFLKELLSSKKCICGNTLYENTESYNNIIQKIELATTKENRELFNECFYILKDKKRSDILEEIKEYISEMSTLIVKIDLLKDEEISLLKSVGDEKLLIKFSEIKNRLTTKYEESKKIAVNRSGIERRKEELVKNLDSKRKERIAAEKKESKFNVEKEKKEFAEKILGHLQKIKYFKEEQGKEGLKEKIEEVYSKVNKKGYKVELTENFEFKIYDNDRSEVGMSKGESKNKALSFIGGLIYYAKELNQKKGVDIFSNGGIYPLVLDAPYGDLDNEYRMEFTKMLPILSEQIIVMVSSGQWNETIEEVVKAKIGKKYILENERRTGDDKTYDVTNIRRG